MSEFDQVNNGVAGLDRPPDERVAVVGDRYEIRRNGQFVVVEVMDVTADGIVIKRTGNPSAITWQTFSLSEFDRITKQAISEGATFIPAK